MRHQRQAALRWWLIGYLVVLFGSLPIARPLWNGWLRDRVGRVMTIERIHVAEYVGLGWLGAAYVRAGSAGWGVAWVMLLVGGVGVLDELVQRLLPGRFFDWSDVWLNLAGGGAGLCLQTVWSRWRVER